jgi:hypothetical protein
MRLGVLDFIRGPRVAARNEVAVADGGEMQTRCIACGREIEPSDEEVRVHGQRAHLDCTVYRRHRAARR